MKAEQPAPDPAKLLKEIKDFLVKKSEPSTNSGGRRSKSWLWAIIIPLIVIAGIAVYSWTAFRRNRELAKLRHEKFKLDFRKEQVELFVEFNKNSSKIEEAGRELALSRDRVRSIDADISALEKKHEADLAAIDSIRSWDEADIRR